MVADPAVEPHHALVSIGADGVATLTQLSSRTPLLVDAAAHRSGGVREGCVVELGDSRIQLGRPRQRPPSMSRFAVLAGVERECYLSRTASPWVVMLGRGRVRLPLSVDPAAAVTELAEAALWEWHDDLPVLADFARDVVYMIGVRGAHADAVIAALVRQLPAGTGRGWCVTSADRPLAEQDPGMPVTVLVRVADGAPIPHECDALLDVGPRWRASWCADLRAGALDVVRFHAAGGGSPSGALVGEQVAGAGTEIGSRVVGVPNPAYGERQASAPDAAGQVVAEAGEHVDLRVESGPPRLGELSPVIRGRRATVR